MAAAFGPAPPPAQRGSGGSGGGGAAPPQLPTQLAFTLAGHEGPVLAVRFNPKGTYCVSCGKDRTLRLWNPFKGLAIKTYAGHGYEARDVSVAADNATMASVGGDRAVLLWDVASGAVVRKFRGHDGTANSVAHTAGGELLVSGGYDACVRFWDLRSRSPDAVQTLRGGFKDDVTAVLPLPPHAPGGGAAVVAGSVDGTVRRFDVRMGRVYVDDLHHPVSGLALTRDGLCVLAACLDSTLRLLDVEAGELLASYTGHTHASVRMGCAVLADDATIVGCSEDGCVLFWELVDALPACAPLQAHASVVCGVAAHPRLPLLLTASVDGTVRVWTADDGG